MKKCSLLCAILISIVSLATSPARVHAEDRDDAETIAKKYFDLWIAGKSCEGVTTCWNVDGLFTEVFKEDYSNLDNSDRLYLQSLFTVFIAATNEQAAVRASLKSGKVSIKEVKKLPSGDSRVTGTLETSGNDREVFADLRESRGIWKIVNLGHNGNGLEALAPAWAGYKKARGKVKLVEFWEVMLSQVLAARFPAKM